MMKIKTTRLLALTAALPLLLGAQLASAAETPTPTSPKSHTKPVRVATFNASLNRKYLGELQKDLSTPNNKQAQNAAETIQRTAPDIVLINEFDYDKAGKSVDLFRKNYLEVSHNGAPAQKYPYAWHGPVNTGIASGFDLNNNGKLGEPDDAWGFGAFPGQYGFVVYSKYPIKMDQVRTFQKFLWKDMPGNLMPVNPDGSPFYSPEETASFPLSSKTHADIPVEIDGTVVHVLADHPTPPIDGPEKRNSRRNFDEIRLWADYISGKADYLYDDAGKKGSLAQDANFVIVGDHNSDPVDGGSWPGAIAQLLKNPRVVDTLPTSQGGPAAAILQGGANDAHKGNPIYDTADFSDKSVGNLRVDYVLPNTGTKVLGAQIFWPVPGDELERLVGYADPLPTSDHRLVWADLQFPAAGKSTGDVAEKGSQQKKDPAPKATEPAPTPTQPNGSATPTPKSSTGSAQANVHQKPNSGALAHTGATVATIGGIGLALLGAGVVIAILRRKK
ncbi:endonuclease/exonuclease/phosphatase family protein [Arcanobacterium canis]